MIGGARNTSSFRDSRVGRRYVHYKTDDNCIGHGAECNSTVASDDVTLTGDSLQILDNDSISNDGVLEGPSFMHGASANYVLFVSSEYYSTAGQTSNYAVISSRIHRLYTRIGMLLKRDGDSHYAPGGADVRKAATIVFHADLGTSMNEALVYGTI